MDIQEPTNKMSTSLSSEQGASTSPTRRTRSARSSRPRSPTRSGRSATARREARRLEPARDHQRRDRRADRGARAAVRGRRLRRPERRRRRVGRRAPDADPRALRGAAGGRARVQRLLAVGAEKARRTAEPTLELMYDRMGFARSEAGRFLGPPGREVCSADRHHVVTSPLPPRVPSGSRERRRSFGSRRN